MGLFFLTAGRPEGLQCDRVEDGKQAHLRKPPRVPLVKPRQRSRMGVGSALYLAAQALPGYSGLVLVLIFVSQFLMRFLLRLGPGPIGVQPIAGDFSALRVLLILIAVILIFVAQTTALPHELKPQTFMHLIVYLFVALGHRSQIPSWPSIRLVRLIVWINSCLLLTYFFHDFRAIFWAENVGQFRFRSYFYEPSIAALVYGLNIIIILERGRRARDSWILIALSGLGLFLTFSGSGFALLAVIIFASLYEKKSIKSVLPLLSFMLALLLVSNTFLLPYLVTEELIFRRIELIFEANADHSAYLRFVAPFLFSYHQLSSGLYGFFGVGIGGIENYISANAADLWFLIEYTGDLSTNLNNGYAVLLALTGLPIWLALLAAATRRVVRSSTPLSLKMFLVFYPMFSGFVIDPLLWLLLVMVGGEPSINHGRIAPKWRIKYANRSSGSSVLRSSV